LAIISHHYRREWEWDDTLMPNNDARLRLWRESLVRGDDDSRLLETVRTHLDNDLDSPAALAAIDDAARSGVAVERAAALLGVDLQENVGPR
jgi:L-cysteine:1D-myo-inositol 2-amino-2-deoxy-alpha-D-glucopyranoside ligase